MEGGRNHEPPIPAPGIQRIRCRNDLEEPGADGKGVRGETSILRSGLINRPITSAIGTCGEGFRHCTSPFGRGVAVTETESEPLGERPVRGSLAPPEYGTTRLPRLPPHKRRVPTRSHSDTVPECAAWGEGARR